MNKRGRRSLQRLANAIMAPSVPAPLRVSPGGKVHQGARRRGELMWPRCGARTEYVGQLIDAEGEAVTCKACLKRLRNRNA